MTAGEDVGAAVGEDVGLRGAVCGLNSGAQGTGPLITSVSLASKVVADDTTSSSITGATRSTSTASVPILVL